MTGLARVWKNQSCTASQTGVLMNRMEPFKDDGRKDEQ
jgi:hypothetical protein